jgi:hypothetical protein
MASVGAEVYASQIAAYQTQQFFQRGIVASQARNLMIGRTGYTSSVMVLNTPSVARGNLPSWKDFVPFWATKRAIDRAVAACQ